MIKNPVLTGFHADPCMIYVDGVFYVATSTFEYFPGVKISASKDLANWDTVGYPLNEKRLLDMEGNPKSCGIWAPALSYCDGLFYLVFTNMRYWRNPYKDSPNYITTAKDIKGPWSNPVYINSSGFDPSLFHDDDGRKYFVNMEWDYRMSNPDNDYDQFSGILVTELDPKSLSPITEPVKIFKGSERGLVEAPHIYKKDGYYYLFTAEGGTKYEHAETIARSKSIYGEYEMHPNTHLICTEDAHESPLRKTGHGSIAQSSDGRWWFAFLCGRPIDESMRCPLGRETSINELVWEDDWPYLKNKTIVPDEYFEGYGTQKPREPVCYDFNSKAFLDDFMSVRSYPKFSVLDNGELRLWGGNSPCCNFEQGLLARRQQDFSFTATTSLKLDGKSFQQMAGLMYRYDEDTYYFLRISHDKAAGTTSLGLLSSDAKSFSIPVEIVLPLLKDDIHMRLTVNRRRGVFSYSFDGTTYIDIGHEIDASTVSDDYADPLGFTGAYVGMCCIDMHDKKAWADFSSFNYTPE
jgi:xylan 1,4-beta-xylosidase